MNAVLEVRKTNHTESTDVNTLNWKIKGSFKMVGRPSPKHCMEHDTHVNSFRKKEML